MNWTLLQNSLLVSGAATLLATLFGVLAALGVSALGHRWRNVVLALTITALALPPFLVTNCWLHFLGATGTWRAWLPFNPFSLGGAAWLLALQLWPVTALAAWAAWQTVEPPLLEADPAARGWPLLRWLLLPLAGKALGFAALLTFVLALNNFAVPAILQVKVLPAEVWVQFSTNLDPIGALRVGWPLVLAPLLVLPWLARQDMPWPRRTGPASARIFRRQLGGGWFASSLVVTALLLTFSVALPAVQLAGSTRTWAELPAAVEAGQSAAWHSFGFAAMSATLVVGIGLALALKIRRAKSEVRSPKGEGGKSNGSKSEIRNQMGQPVATGLRRPSGAGVSPAIVPTGVPPVVPNANRDGWRDDGSRDGLPHYGGDGQSPPTTVTGFGSRISDFLRISDFGFRICCRWICRLRTSDFGLRTFCRTFLCWLPFFVPGVLLGIALIALFNRPATFWLYRGAGIVVAALVLRYFALGWNGAALALRQTDPDLADAARLDGASRWQLLRHILWPQIAPQIVAAWYVVYLLCLWDVESLVLIIPPGGETLALRIFNLLHYGHNAQVNALCLTLLALALAPLAIGAIVVGARRLFSGRDFASALPRTAAAGLLLLLVAMLPAGCTRQETANEASLSSAMFEKAVVFGTRGVGVGQFNKPRSVAVDAADHLYAADMTGRVQKFTPDGRYVLAWQLPQTVLGKPKGMARDAAGNIIVIEPHYQRVNHFTPEGRLVAQWGVSGTNAGQLKMPRAVVVNSHGEICVAEYGVVERVQRFALREDIASSWSAGLRPGAVNLASGLQGDSAVEPSEGGAQSAPGRRPALRVDTEPLARTNAGVESPANRQTGMSALHPTHAELLGSFGHYGTEAGEFNRPEGIAVDAQDRIYVADSCNHRIQVFDREGRFLRAFGRPGAGRGELSYPYDVCVDAAGHVYVCEFGNSRIQVFDAAGAPLEIIGGPGVEPGRFNNPWGLALDSRGNLYVADALNNRVQKLVRRAAAAAEIRNPKSEIRRKSEARNPKAEGAGSHAASSGAPNANRDGWRDGGSRDGLPHYGGDGRTPPGTPAGFELRTSGSGLRFSVFGFRASFGFRFSDFGFPPFPPFSP